MEGRRRNKNVDILDIASDTLGYITLKRLIIEGDVDKKIPIGLSLAMVKSDYVYKASLEDFSSILPGIFCFFPKSVPEVYI